jgi:hypothetical protein
MTLGSFKDDARNGKHLNSDSFSIPRGKPAAGWYGSGVRGRAGTDLHGPERYETGGLLRWAMANTFLRRSSLANQHSVPVTE